MNPPFSPEASLPPAPWPAQTDAQLLCALANREMGALRELHRRYSPVLYALAARIPGADPEPRVQDAWLLIMRQAHCHARTPLEARVWIVATAQRVLRAPVGRT
ncbi:hypothetical protein [Deinococcus hohokamensis]|uniref:RNA polymerase sigma-70 region 2 domain-containing protein n=1 Tax=Deinococcus hohokamensis TaxID=309883 RepID=A0ABV9IAY1_9DEIO